MVSNPLVDLQKLGQSIWYDNIRRALILTGDLKRKIEQDDLRGVTSNPAIFEKAIAGSTDYKEALQALASKGKNATEIYEDLAVEDVQMAADLFLPVYDRTGGTDGYISLEVSPLLATDTKGTIAEARRLWERLNKKNVMIKVPATPEGIPAVEQLIADGINVNVTLIFSQDAYEKVARAYIAGLQKRSAEGKPLDHVASVASFFVSRIDTAVDNQLGFNIRRSTDPKEIALLSSLLGKIAIANAKMAYQTFKRIFKEPTFAALQAKGARVQRQLWASTGTKDANYSDVLYVENLIGPDTVNTVPPATYSAYRDHGRPRPTLEENLDEARSALHSLEQAGLSLPQITSQLLDEAVKAFVDPFNKLLTAVEEKRIAAATSIVDRQSVSVGNFAPTVEKALNLIKDRDYVRRMWRKDTTVWKQEPSHQKIIQNSLGWLTVADSMLEHAKDLKAFAERVRSDGFQDVMLLGMGGSSLCPEVFRRTFGQIPGYPRLHVLDSTDPATVRSMEQAVDVAKTLFIVASKSGSTTEPHMFYQYFFDRVSKVKPDRPGANFVAITDPGSLLEQIAKEKQFRRIFQNPADIGGRYSALSFFGIVPAALMGLDIEEILERAVRAAHACERFVPCEENPGARAGAILGALASHRKDKVTFVISPPIDSLGLWIEQLIAESTGKEGIGILPVAGEPLGGPEVYGHDRIFVYITTQAFHSEEIEAKLAELQEAGHPVVRHVMRDELSLGREFFLWEIATALAGSLMGINPFDQPNVQESKDNTKALLELYKKEERLPSQEVIWEQNDSRIYGDGATRTTLQKIIEEKKGTGSLEDFIAAHMSRCKEGDYVAFTAYIMENEEHDRLLQLLRTHVRDSLRVATTVGYGPRFLHSTGQLHKGGSNAGVFIQITQDETEDLPIPGEPYSFGVLKQAQALGDFQSLSNRNRRAIRFHVGKDTKAGLNALLNAMQSALPRRNR